MDLLQGWEQGQEIIEATQRERCSGDVPGDTQRSLRVQNHIDDVSWKHVLLPVWSLAYRYRGKGYRVLVHGQTGRVVGEAPYSWVKIALAVLGGLALVVGVGAVSSMARTNDGPALSARWPMTSCTAKVKDASFSTVNVADADSGLSATASRGRAVSSSHVREPPSSGRFRPTPCPSSSSMRRRSRAPHPRWTSCAVCKFARRTPWSGWTRPRVGSARSSG